MNSFRIGAVSLRKSALVMMLPGLLLLAGCGGDNSTNHVVHGTVTYGGEPVPAGSVSLIPDASKGNSGKAISIEIRDGKFDSRWMGKGHEGGAYRVRVTGLDGKADDEFFPNGTLLFPEYAEEWDLPPELTQRDIEVPGDLKLPKVRTTPHQGP